MSKVALIWGKLPLTDFVVLAGFNIKLHCLLIPVAFRLLHTTEQLLTTYSNLNTDAN